MTVFGLDLPGTVCAFDSNRCSHSAAGHGGFDEHHALPLSMGGDNRQDLLALCPLHHARQHSLVRYLVEAGNAPAWAVLKHFTPDERATAAYAIRQWQRLGSPSVSGWSRPAARP